MFTNWRLKYCNSVSIEYIHFAGHFILHHLLQVVLQSNVTKFGRNVLHMDPADHLSGRLPTGNLNIFNIHVILHCRLHWESTCPQNDINVTMQYSQTKHMTLYYKYCKYNIVCVKEFVKTGLWIIYIIFMHSSISCTINLVR